MKILLTVTILVFVCFRITLHAQSITPTVSKNYVVENTVLVANKTTEAMVNNALVYNIEKRTQVTYFDGLGRPIQNVEVGITGSVAQSDNGLKDRITSIEYDIYGRESIKYLPYGRVQVNGSFDNSWKTNLPAYYTSGDLKGVETSTAPFSQTVYESSPLNRPLAQGAPGIAWQPNLNDPYDVSKKSVQFKYEFNTTSDNVRIFDVDNTTQQINSTGIYTAGMLSVKVGIDENGGITKEFTDKTGHTILKKVFIENQVLQTYYIYDNLELLRGVIQPEGVASIPATGNWLPDAAFKSNWMFLYSYDQRNRMTIKQVPGANPVYMIYDKLDRLVLTQDGNQKNTNKWLFTKYDILNRPVMTGSIVDGRDRSLIQADIDQAGYFETVNTAVSEGYTLTASFPSASVYTLTIFTITHYDSYTSLPSWKSNFDFVAESAGFPSYPTTYNDNVKGQIVATQIRVIGTNNYLRSVSYFNDKYRLIQVSSDNNAGGKDRVTNYPLFDGRILRSRQSHTSQFFSTPNIIERSFSFNSASQIKDVYHSVNNITGIGGHVVSMSYNDMGQLFIKRLENVSPSSPNSASFQKLDYSYNIRGWLTGVNKPYAESAGYDETDLFNFELHYNTTTLGGDATYNGNIAEQVWKGGYDEYLRGYKYTYDKANRLKTSDYGFKYTNSYNGQVWDFSMRYNENVVAIDGSSGYDMNGNIKRLERFHGAWNRVDDLNYDYRNANTNNLSDGNRLHKVVDGVFNNLPVGFKDHDNWFNDYNYDANGNLTNDYNKDIGNIQYNHLNLPTMVDFGTAKGTIEYLYDAGGSKLQKTVTDKTVSPNKITITKYAGAYVYSINYLSGTTPPAETLEFIIHEEGRIRPAKIDLAQPLTAANTNYIYDYFMKDHLGNTRMVLTTEEQTDLYAATQEPANATKENQIFSNISSTTLTKPGGFDTDNANTQVSKVNGGATATRVGPSIILKVMAGDVVSLGTQAWYTGATQAPPNGLAPIADQLLTLLTAGIAANGGTHSGAIPLADINTGAGEVLDEFLTTQTYSSTRPKAFLNWIIVDEEFKKVSSSFHMGAVQVPLITGTMQKQQLTGPANMTVRRNGWLYVYVSNESNQEVYFDDLVVNHKRGPVVEANNYYAFGLEIQGLASRAIGFGGGESRRKFNGGNELQSKEFSDGSGLELYDATFRMYDPQIGRFNRIDPLSEIDESWSPYSFVHNNPISFSDPLGLAVDSTPKPPVSAKPGNPDVMIPIVPGCSPCATPAGPGPINTSAATAAFPLALGGTLEAIGGGAVATVEIGVGGTAAIVAGVILAPGIIYEHYHPTPGISYLPRGINGGGDISSYAKPYAGPIAIPNFLPNVGSGVRVITSNTLGEQYALRARTDGFYPNYQFGRGQVGFKWLSKGDIWKIGTTINGPGRYSNSFYSNTGAGLLYTPEFGPAPIDQILFVERMKLLNYAIQHNGELPAGNTKLQ